MSLPPHHGHMLFCDGNFGELIKYSLLYVLAHTADAIGADGATGAAEWGVIGAEDRCFWGSVCGPTTNTPPSSQITKGGSPARDLGRER